MTRKAPIATAEPDEPSASSSPADTAPAAADVAAVPVRRRADPKSPGARATRKWRARKAAGVRLVHVDLAEVEIDDLIKLGLIDPAKRTDNRELNRAVLAMVEDGIERRQPGTYTTRRNNPASQRLAAEARSRGRGW